MIDSRKGQTGVFFESFWKTWGNGCNGISLLAVCAFIIATCCLSMSHIAMLLQTWNAKKTYQPCPFMCGAVGSLYHYIRQIIWKVSLLSVCLYIQCSCHYHPNTEIKPHSFAWHTVLNRLRSLPTDMEMWVCMVKKVYACSFCCVGMLCVGTNTIDYSWDINHGSKEKGACSSEPQVHNQFMSAAFLFTLKNRLTSEIWRWEWGVSGSGCFEVMREGFVCLQPLNWR